MRWNEHLFALGVISLLAGCSISKPERIISLRDIEQNRTAPNRQVSFVESWDAKFLPVDAPLFGGHDEILHVLLDTNGQARVRLSKVRWWAQADLDGTCGTSLKPLDIRDGGTFRLYRPPPVPSDTNIYAPQYVLTIENTMTLGADNTRPPK